jgi:hypothetical protein
MGAFKHLALVMTANEDIRHICMQAGQTLLHVVAQACNDDPFKMEEYLEIVGELIHHGFSLFAVDNVCFHRPSTSSGDVTCPSIPSSANLFRALQTVTHRLPACHGYYLSTVHHA